jgi:ubiquinone/menaquinone biosynthesis C-methylase UbiE
MLKRIPHTDLEVITGEQTTDQYLKMQKRMGRFYLSRFLIAVEKQNKTGKFLEIGSGPGYQTVQVAKRITDSRITVLEPSSDMIKVATSYSLSHNVNDRITFVEGVVEDDTLIQSLGKFDLIYSTFSLHHWKEPVRAINNLYKALKEDGVLLVYDLERHWLTYYLPLQRGIAESIRASYTPKELISIMASTNSKNYTIEKHFPYLSLIIRK